MILILWHTGRLVGIRPNNDVRCDDAFNGRDFAVSVIDEGSWKNITGFYPGNMGDLRLGAGNLDGNWNFTRRGMNRCNTGCTDQHGDQQREKSVESGNEVELSLDHSLPVFYFVDTNGLNQRSDGEYKPRSL